MGKIFDLIKGKISKHNNSPMESSWTFYDSYKSKGQAEYYGKILKRGGKYVKITNTEFDDGTVNWKLWYKE